MLHSGELIYPAPPASLGPWLLAYFHLMGAVNYLGGEQALCTAFHSVICFGHREIFLYAELHLLRRIHLQALPARASS